MLLRAVILASALICGSTLAVSLKGFKRTYTFEPNLHTALYTTSVISQDYSEPNCNGKQVIVHLFEWSWDAVANECEQYLGPKGFCGVQVNFDSLWKSGVFFSDFPPFHCRSLPPWSISRVLPGGRVTSLSLTSFSRGPETVNSSPTWSGGAMLRVSTSSQTQWSTTWGEQSICLLTLLLFDTIQCPNNGLTCCASFHVMSSSLKMPIKLILS